MRPICKDFSGCLEPGKIRFQLFLALCLALSGSAFGQKPLSPLLRLERAGIKVGALFSLNGKTVYQHRSEERFNPASVTKVFTAALALAVLGADTVFETQVLAKQENAGLILSIVGSGDPMLTDVDLQSLAKSVRDSGISEVSRLIVDTGPFNQDAVPPAFGQKQSDQPYRAGIAGLQVNFNRIVVTVSPSAPGKPPVVAVTPQSEYFHVINEAVTVKKKKGLKPLEVRVISDGKQVSLSVRGSVSQKNPVVAAKLVPSPALHAGYVFKAALEKVGVRVRRGPILGKAPAGSKMVAKHESPPVREMLVPLLKESQNQIAESLLRLCGARKASGRPVGFREGILALEDFLVREIGLAREGFEFQNGSGLYQANLVTPQATVRLLEFIHTHDKFAPILAALPVAGKDGTLRRRFLGTALEGRVRAKTGTLANVVSLAGFIGLRDGRTLTFMVVAEGGKRFRAAEVRAAVDQAILKVVEDLEGARGSNK